MPESIFGAYSLGRKVLEYEEKFLKKILTILVYLGWLINMAKKIKKIQNYVKI